MTTNNQTRGGFFDATHRNYQTFIGVPYLMIWGLIVIELVLITIMFGINIIGGPWRGLNVPIAIISTMALLFVGFRPTNLLWAGGIGGFIAFLQDRDKSQGLTLGALWQYRIIISVSSSFLLCSYLLIFRDFSSAPLAFWVIFIGAIFLVMLASIQVGTNWAKQLVTVMIAMSMMIAFSWTFQKKQPRQAYVQPAATQSVTSFAQRPAARAIPPGALTSVKAPACNDGWSRTVTIPADWNVTTSWTTQVANFQWRQSGQWKSFSGSMIPGNVDALRVCAKMPTYVNQNMPLTWTR